MRTFKEAKGENVGMSIFMGGDGGYSLADSMLEAERQSERQAQAQGEIPEPQTISKRHPEDDVDSIPPAFTPGGHHPELLTLFQKAAGREIYKRLCERGRERGFERNNGIVSDPPKRLTTEEARYVIERHFYHFADSRSVEEIEAEIGAFLRARIDENPIRVREKFPKLDDICYVEEYDPDTEFPGLV